MITPRHYSPASRGFTLIEVLVTMVIIAIGIMGLAGLQMTSLNSQFESYQRTQALLLVEDMSNRLRANAVAARAWLAQDPELKAAVYLTGWDGADKKAA